MTYPAPAKRFRPRLESGLLSRAIQAAWQEHQDRIYPEAELKRVRNIIATYLKAIHPPEELAILARHDCIKEIYGIGVQMHNGCDYGKTMWIEFDGKIAVAPSISTMLACGTRHSQDPGRGCTEEYREQCAPEEWASLIADQDRRERRFVPDSVNGFFAGIAAAKKMFGNEYRQTFEFPKKYRDEKGKYPTWAEIADSFPVLGTFLRSAHGESS